MLIHFAANKKQNMKVIICGKGGSGKSTITALLARHYASEGRRVLVVDTDMSNVGLHRILGTGAPPDLTGHFGGKGGRRRDNPQMPHPSQLPGQAPVRRSGPPPPPAPGTWTYDKIPEGYSAEKDGIKLVSIGKITDAYQFGKGYWTGMARRFLGGLALEGSDIALIDAEAGVEHLDRGLAKECELVLMVAEPSLASIDMALTVSLMLEQEGVPLYFVLNKTDAETSSIVRNSLATSSDRIIGEFPKAPVILEAGLEGRAFPAGYPAAAALAQRMEQLRAMATPSVAFGL